MYSTLKSLLETVWVLDYQVLLNFIFFATDMYRNVVTPESYFVNRIPFYWLRGYGVPTT